MAIGQTDRDEDIEVLALGAGTKLEWQLVAYAIYHRRGFLSTPRN